MEQKDISHFRSFSDFLNSNTQSNEKLEVKENQQGVKLVEIGPRMKLKFMSFKEGFGRI